MIEKINVLIVEDEALTAESLKFSIQSLGYNVAGIASNATDALDFLQKDKIDFAILDINIQGNKNGIWLANFISNTYNIPFIFLTAYNDQKTIKKAVNTKPHGYLIKPYIKENISASIQIALINFTNNKVSEDNIVGEKGEEVSVLEDKKNFFIKHKNAHVKIEFKDVYFLEADNNYINIQTSENIYMIRTSLSKVLQLLPKNFIQVHRSFIVNSENIELIDTLFIEIKEYKIPLSNSYRTKLFEFINKI